MLELLKKISAAPGVSGYENKAADVIEKEISEYTDEQYRDNLGNLIAVKHGNGNGKKIMLCAHMDEIGFMVTFIEEHGEIRIAPIGGISLSAVNYDKVVSENGVKGIVVPNGNVKPVDYTVDKMYIDIGAQSKKEAEKKVSIGDVFRYDSGIVKLSGTRVCGHPIDDRIGCTVLVEIAKRLNGENIGNDIYYVFSVQEEVGCRGSKTASFGIQPDIGIAFDVTGTGDVPGASPMACAVGKGAAIKVKDASVICDTKLVEELTETAKKNGIKHQHEILLYGGTDTSSMQMTATGCRAAAISIPSRYIHTGNELIDMKDAHAAVELAVVYIKGLK